MLNSKQRKYLRSKAALMKDIIHIGKDGLSENIAKQADDALEKRELIKGKIQQNSLVDVKEAASFLSEKANCEVVCTIGNKFVLYRKNDDKNIYNL